MKQGPRPPLSQWLGGQARLHMNSLETLSHANYSCSLEIMSGLTTFPSITSVVCLHPVNICAQKNTYQLINLLCHLGRTHNRDTGLLTGETSFCSCNSKRQIPIIGVLTTGPVTRLDNKLAKGISAFNYWTIPKILDGNKTQILLRIGNGQGRNWMTSLDLQDIYHTCSIHRGSRK